ncbi:MAG: YhcH/YjgK/YiaL family protein [Mariniphaga sp.]|nr:YhcH/YjgK/YiaL family protein [Mariniphaga sp.]
MKNLTFILLFLIICISCSQKNNNPEKWSDEEITEWFEKGEWLSGWNVKPDASINKRTMAIQYFKNSRHWDQAINFLKSSDLENMPVGRQELEREHLFVIVDEYTSKDKSETRYESHRKYLDIQYVISGKEIMGLTTAEKVKITDPYFDGNDIIFYEYEGGDYILASPSNFLVFFPEDIHRPTIAVEEGEPVKKIVVKILME